MRDSKVQSVEPDPGRHPTVRQHAGGPTHDRELIGPKFMRDRDRTAGHDVDGELSGVEPAARGEPSAQPAVASRTVADEVAFERPDRLRDAGWVNREEVRAGTVEGHARQ